jgi:hypothetical protein
VDYKSGQVATIELTAQDGQNLIASARLIQDPNYFQFNRIELLGSARDELSARPLMGQGVIEWKLFDHSNATGKPPCHNCSGNGILRSLSIFQGEHVAPETIQVYGVIEIFEVREVFRWKNSREVPSSEIWFLQRPADWDHNLPEGLIARSIRKVGPWHRSRSTGCEFRLKSVHWRRNDDRISREAELLTIPAIEMRPSDRTSTTFANEWTRIWQVVRVLLSFRFRQTFWPLYECYQEKNQSISTYYSLPFEHPVDRILNEDEVFYDKTENYIARGLKSLYLISENLPIIHGAIHGYSKSFSAITPSEQLTSVVEGLERLIAIYEEISALKRELVPANEWRSIVKALKTSIEKQDIRPQLAAELKRHVSSKPVLSLQQRIERMAARQRPCWEPRDTRLLHGLSGLIKMRNDVVHGRRVDDFQALSVNVTRGQLLFERLFLGICGNAKVRRLQRSSDFVARWDEKQTSQAKSYQ